MFLFKTVSALQDYLQTQRVRGRKLGFVPTMGALHSGHLHLIKKAQELSDIVICSIFVNPKQFNDEKDLRQYPRPIHSDLEQLYQIQTSVMFWPSEDQMYPLDASDPTLDYSLGPLGQIWEGAHRPGHFKGVVRVVHRLLDIFRPDILIMGKKDYQQLAIIRQMLNHYDFGHPIQLLGVPIVRDKNGLALSSRNQRLCPQDRREAARIFTSLQWIKSNAYLLPLDEVLSQAIKLLDQSPVEKIEYLQIVNPYDMQAINAWPKDEPCLAIVAVWVDGIRLIDNIEIPAFPA